MHLPSETHGAVQSRFIAGNPLTGTRPTIVTPELLNALTFEIAHTVTAANIDLVQGNEHQLVDAILTLIIRTIRAGGQVCLDDMELDGGELDDDGNIAGDSLNQCFAVQFDPDITLDDLKSELDYYDHIDSGAI